MEPRDAQVLVLKLTDPVSSPECAEMDSRVHVVSSEPVLWSRVVREPLRHREKHRALGSMEEEFTALWSYHFSLYLSLTLSVGPRWSGMYWSIYLLSPFPSLSFCLPLALFHPLFLTRARKRVHILFPITDVPFHQMETKAKLWAFIATWDPFNLQQHEGKWGQICQAQLTPPSWFIMSSS